MDKIRTVCYYNRRTRNLLFHLVVINSTIATQEYQNPRRSSTTTTIDYLNSYLNSFIFYFKLNVINN